jgi:hypothetical protein
MLRTFDPRNSGQYCVKGISDESEASSVFEKRVSAKPIT